VPFVCHQLNSFEFSIGQWQFFRGPPVAAIVKELIEPFPRLLFLMQTELSCHQVSSHTLVGSGMLCQAQGHCRPMGHDINIGIAIIKLPEKAIVFPSGENLGKVSTPAGELINSCTAFSRYDQTSFA